ncbi:hypothetical protein AcV7_007373 [Taiwanofungus camphoratus]|nr:hypothetical protein AcV7_007373 [Antrodia cinnamomea]
MPEKTVETPYPLIDADPHAFRVVRYMRPSDYGVWATLTGAFPGALYFWDMADPTKYKLRTHLRLGGLLGFVGGFLMAYQRSSCKYILFLPFIVAYFFRQSDSGDGPRTSVRRPWTARN